MREILNKTRIHKLITENSRFYNALFIITISAVVSQGLNFLTMILITREIGESNIGHFSVIQSIVIFLVSFGLLGQNISSAALASRFKKRYPHHLGLLIGNSYMLSTVILILVGIFVGYSADYIFPEIYLDSFPRLGSIAFVIFWTFTMTFDMMQVSVLIGLEAYRDLIKTDVLKGIISISLIYPLSIRYGISGILAGYIISSLMGVITNQFFIRKNLKILKTCIRFKYSLKIIMRILNIGLPVFIAALFISFATWLTNKMVFAEFNGPAALGIVFVCRQIMIMIQFFPVQISRVLLPIISEDKEMNNKRLVRRTSLITVVAICTVLAVAGLLFEDYILKAYNVDSVSASLPYRIILIAVIFSSVNLVLGQFVIAGKNPWVRTYADMVIALVMIGITFVLKDNYLSVAIPWALLISYVLSDIMIGFYLRGKPLSINGITSDSFSKS
jgi:O-antigen/teichoic acid export membrane protein